MKYFRCIFCNGDLHLNTCFKYSRIITDKTKIFWKFLTYKDSIKHYLHARKCTYMKATDLILDVRCWCKQFEIIPLVMAVFSLHLDMCLDAPYLHRHDLNFLVHFLVSWKSFYATMNQFDNRTCTANELITCM